MDDSQRIKLHPNRKVRRVINAVSLRPSNNVSFVTYQQMRIVFIENAV